VRVYKYAQYLPLKSKYWNQNKLEPFTASFELFVIVYILA